MSIARQSESGLDLGKWYAVVPGRRGATRKVGYCAAGCTGHDTATLALAHHLEYQLDREASLWLVRRSSVLPCEVCGDPTPLRARLGSGVPLFVLCPQHQSTRSLRELSVRRASSTDA